MSNNQLAKNLMETLERVDSKLEKLLDNPIILKEDVFPKTVDAPEEDFSDDIDSHETHRSSAHSKNSMPSRVAISMMETDAIIQKVEKINRDAEVMERVERLERQNRKIVILGSMFITLTVLMLGVFAFLMVQANLLNQGIFLKTSQRINPSQPPSGEAAAQVTVPEPPKPIAEVHDPKPAEPIAKVSDPQPVATPIVPKPAEAAAAGKYVGSLTSNKYHYPGCKWAAQIRPNNLLNFSTVEEARKRAYIPCPTCKPPHSDQEKLSP